MTAHKLTDTQLVLLPKAAQREDGALTSGERLKGGAAVKVATKLVEQGLVREVRAKAGMPVWRRDAAQNRDYALVITKRARDAIGVEEEMPAATTMDVPASLRPVAEKRPSKARIVMVAAPPSPRPASKLATVIDLLRQADGATLDALTAATGWLPHTMRAALTRLRKRGYAVERQRGEDKITRYRIPPQDKLPTA